MSVVTSSRQASCPIGSKAKNILRTGKYYTLQILSDEYEANYGLYNKEHGLLEYKSFSLPQAIATFDWFEEALDEMSKGESTGTVYDFPDPTQH